MKRIRPTIRSVSASYDLEPRLVKSVLKALQEELKKARTPVTHVVSFLCPNCDTALGVRVNPGKKMLNKVARKQRRSNFASGVNKVVLQLAKLRGCMTADIHRDFTKLLGARARKLSKEEYREQKLAWLRSEISKARRKSKAA